MNIRSANNILQKRIGQIFARRVRRLNIAEAHTNAMLRRYLHGCSGGVGGIQSSRFRYPMCRSRRWRGLRRIQSK